MPREMGSKYESCADINGFSLHAAVRCRADERPAVEQLCRYDARATLSSVVLMLKTPWRDGTTYLVMSPLEFMRRLAALVPRPRLAIRTLCAERAARATALRKPIWGSECQQRVDSVNTRRHQEADLGSHGPSRRTAGSWPGCELARSASPCRWPRSTSRQLTRQCSPRTRAGGDHEEDDTLR
jgi:hypothetical protein